MKRSSIYLILIFVLAVFFRLYGLGQIPVSLHGDEVGVGYNAYSLLVRGIDEYGKPWPLTFRADVAPFIFYASVPAIALFGLSDFAVRFPSFVIGVATVIAVYFFTKELVMVIKLQQVVDKSLQGTQIKLPLLVSLLFAISPWHIQISRIAHDASYGLLLQITALTFFLKYIQKQEPLWLILTTVTFALTFYAYHSPRLTTPLLIVSSVWIFRSYFLHKKGNLILVILLFGFLIFPMVWDFISKPLSQTRFGGINIFIREAPTEPLWLLPLKLTVNYLNQFNPVYLFRDTTPMRYFNINNIGLLYITDLFFLLIGLMTVIHIRLLRKVLFVWIVIAALPGALTLGIPNGGRILLLLPFLEILVALGMWRLVTFQSKRFQSLSATIVILAAINAAYFMHQYFIDSQVRFTTVWQYGAKEVAEVAVQQEDYVDKIIITDSLKQGYMYVLFYGRKDPLWLKELPDKKYHHFIGYTQFGKYEFRSIDWEKDKELEKALLVGTAVEIPPGVNTVAEIKNDTNTQILFRARKT